MNRSGESVISTASSDPLLVNREQLMLRFAEVRDFTSKLCATLEPEDCVVQSMPDVSPTRWHLAHTTWFFEQFVLAEIPKYQPVSPDYEYLFNSYYNSVGAQFPRPQRGLLSRPTVAEVMQYRSAVDERMGELLSSSREVSDDLLRTIELGLHHEQQHQELMLTDIKHVFSMNPLAQTYRPATAPPPRRTDLDWVEYSADLEWVGHTGAGFHYDNERPRHREYLEDRRLGSRLITNGEYRRFVEDDGYRRSEFWLSAGWATVLEQGWQAPLYWQRKGETWSQFTLQGRRPLVDDEPVCHVSYYEADAFARWSDARLPTEAEWEVAARDCSTQGNFVESEWFTPNSPADGPSTEQKDEPQQLFGDVWEWTASPYVAYPGYRPPEGAIGEYNGKFMCNQFVLRGGSCATSQTHIRPTYRNFFPPDARWQFSGIRLAQ